MKECAIAKLKAKDFEYQWELKNKVENSDEKWIYAHNSQHVREKDNNIVT